MEKKKKVKNVIFAGTIATSLLLPPVQALATPTSNPSSVNPRIIALEKQTKDLSDAMNRLETQIQQYDNSIIESMYNIEKVNGQIKQEEEKAAKLRSEIKSIQERLNRATSLAKERLQSLQSVGIHQHYALLFNVLFSSNGIADFVQRMTAVVTILQSDQELIKSIQEDEKQLEEKQKELEQHLLSLKQKREQVEEEKKKIEQEKQKIQQEIQRLEKIKEQLEELKRKELEKEIQQQAQLQREREQWAQSQNQTLYGISATVETDGNSFYQPATGSSLAFSSISPSNSELAENENENIDGINKSKAQLVIERAKQFLGVPYVWGGTTPNGFDCSGFTQYVFRSVGVELPRVARQQQLVGTPIPVSQIQPGDLIFWGYPAHHVAIYIGNGKYIHAPRTGDVVKISKLKPSGVTSATRVLN